MHPRKHQMILPCVMLLAGILGMVLRLLLNTDCLDQRQLLPAMHPLGMASGLVAVAALALAFCSARKQEKLEGDCPDFPGSRLAFLGHLLAALGILLTVAGSVPAATGGLGLVWKALGFVSVPCLAAAGWFRLRGKQPFFLLHLVPSVFLVVHTITQYQIWSSDPQLLNYIFSLFGIICMLFFTFYYSAYDAGLPWRRRLIFFALASVCLGLMALPGCSYPWLYLGITLWALMELPSQTVSKEGDGE